MWSRNYESCIQCNSVKFIHMAKGYCSSCYAKKYKSNPENKDRMRKQKAEWFQLNKDLVQMKQKRDEVHFDGKRKEVLKRDNFKCTICNSTENITVHHKDGKGRGYTNPNNELSNLSTLCRKCHINIHRKDLDTNRHKWKQEGKWSKLYNECLLCKTTEKQHAYKGFCRNCVGKAKRRKMI